VKYLCLIFQDEKAADTFAAMTPSEQQTWRDAFRDFQESIALSGHYVASGALQPPSSATTVRVRGGKASTTDGPFAETKEQVGGFYLIEARDLNEAIQIATRIPAARFGAIEVRPLRDGSR